jgi:hypothetical protein
MIEPTRAESPTALVAVVALLALAGVLVPLAFVGVAPVLLVLGVRTLRDAPSGVTRTVGWVALVLGAVLLVVPLVALLGLTAVSAGAGTEAAGALPD